MGTTDYDNHPEATADVYYRLEEKAFAEGQRVDQIQEVPAQDGTNGGSTTASTRSMASMEKSLESSALHRTSRGDRNTGTKLHESEEWLRDAQEIAGLSSYVLDIPNKQWIVSAGLADSAWHRG